jgi:hypothetical protein
MRHAGRAQKLLGACGTCVEELHESEERVNHSPGSRVGAILR